MAQIPDFTSEAFDDPKYLRQTLTAILRKLDSDANSVPSNPLQSNELIPWVDDGKTPIPSGYEKADGRNMTFDSKSSNIIYIMKVSG